MASKTSKPDEATQSVVAPTEKENSSLAEVPSHINIDMEDIDIPRINVVQATSQLDGPQGSLLHNKEDVLAEKDVELDVVVVTAKKGWRQDIPYGTSDELPEIAWTRDRADMVAENGDYPMLEFAEITFLIRKPDDAEDDGAYTIPIGGVDYAIGSLNVAKNAYRSTYKRITTFAAFNKGVNLSSRVFKLKSELMTKGRNSWYSPTLRVSKDEAGEDVREFLESFAS